MNRSLHRTRVRALRCTALPLLLIGCCIQPAFAAEPAPTGIDRPTSALPGAQPGDLSRNPVAQFRQLLALEPTALETALSNRPESARRFLLARVHDYAAMPAADREAKLRLMELHWEATVLLTSPRTNRFALLAQLPADHRTVLEPRLAQWDLLPADLQADLLRNEQGLQSFLKLAEVNRSAAPPAPPQPPSPLELEIAQWQRLPREQQLALHHNFLKFFELPSDRRAASLAALPAAERADIERSVSVLARLSPVEREQCLQALNKLTQMSSEDRQAFIKNADRWRSMSAEDQTTWRKLAPHLPPPPPGFHTTNR